MAVLVAGASLDQQLLHSRQSRIRSSPPHPKRLVCHCTFRNSNSNNNSSKLLLNVNTSGGSINRENFYQPFRPPPAPFDSPLPLQEQLQLISERRGQWYHYGKHIPVLLRTGFTPASLDEATGLNGVEQNQIVVACQVRDALLSTGITEDSLSFFDNNPAALYELRTLSTQQRRLAAEYVMDEGLDAKEAREAARAVKDFPRRRREFGWEFFSQNSPGDCLAYWLYRQSKEFKDTSDKQEVLAKAVSFATSDAARDFLTSCMGVKKSPVSETSPDSQSKKSAVDLTIPVRLNLGENAGLVMLPVAEPDAGSVREAPAGSALGEGGFRIHRGDKGWRAWVPLPGWKPILEAAAPVTVLFPDKKTLGLKQKGGKQSEDEEVLLVVDKGKTEVSEEFGSVYLVSSGGTQGLSLENGGNVTAEHEILGRVIIALTSPDSAAAQAEID